MILGVYNPSSIFIQLKMFSKPQMLIFFPNLVPSQQLFPNSFSPITTPTFLLILGRGEHLEVLRAYSAFRGHACWGWGDHMRFWKLNLGRPCPRQVPSHCIISPAHFIALFFVNFVSLGNLLRTEGGWVQGPLSEPLQEYRCGISIWQGCMEGKWVKPLTSQ